MTNKPIKKNMLQYIQRIAKHILLQRSWSELTQTELGNTIGVTFQQVQKWEKGKNRITADQLYFLYDEMNWSIASLDKEPELVLEYFCQKDYPNKPPEKYYYIKRKWLTGYTPSVTPVTPQDERI
ncbi:MAG: helix-turn-helix transcriptional regulator [Proteobacteria bacterium]|nr:helix-turn-helix transcriptional regulator [Pseudomonadota bacterium]